MEQTRELQAATLLMREVICARVFRKRMVFVETHPVRALGLRDIEAADVIPHATTRVLTMTESELRGFAEHVLDLIDARLAARPR